MRPVLALIRFAVAAGIVAALVGQLITTFTYWAGQGFSAPALIVTNFLSYFTVESNALSAVVLIIGGVLLLRRRGADPGWFTVLRLVAVTYLGTTGVVYNLLLRGVELPQGLTLGWSNEILHVVAPIWMVLDWLLAPGRAAVEWRRIGVVVAFPILWAFYTLIRGPLVDYVLMGHDYWYPYPFLNPVLSQNGYLSVAFYVVLIAAVIGGMGCASVALSRRTRPAVR